MTKINYFDRRTNEVREQSRDLLNFIYIVSRLDCYEILDKYSTETITIRSFARAMFSCAVLQLFKSPMLYFYIFFSNNKNSSYKTTLVKVLFHKSYGSKTYNCFSKVLEVKVKSTSTIFILKLALLAV